MKLELFLAGKYLFKKKSSQAIHLITGISVLGITIGTAVLVIVLSVFNGFEDLLSGMFSRYNPDIKIVSARSGLFEADRGLIEKIRTMDGVMAVSGSLDQTAMIQYDESQDFGIVKGVDSNYSKVVPIDSALLESLQGADVAFAYLGLGLANKLGVSLDNILTKLYLYTPSGDWEESGLSAEDFGKHSVIPTGVFSMHQDLDNEMVIIGLDQLREWTGSEHKLSALEIRLKPDASTTQIVKQIDEWAGPEFLVKDRYRQDEAFLKIMNLEKWLFYLLFSLTLVLVSFTIMGALWMVVLEKRMDIASLKAMGMTNESIRKVFLWLGMGMGLLGLIAGFLLAIIFYSLQTQYALIRVPEEFIIDSYPISLKATDFLTVSLTVLTITWLACLLPVAKIREVPAIFREE